MTGVRVVGAKKARRYLEELKDQAHSANDATVRVGATAPYAYGIETGHRRSGRLARAAGGVFFLSRAYEHVKPKIPKFITKAIDQREGALEGLKRAGFEVERRAKELLGAMAYSPRTRYRTHSLQRSVQTVWSGRPVNPFSAPRTRATVRPR